MSEQVSQVTKLEAIGTVDQAVTALQLRMVKLEKEGHSIISFSAKAMEHVVSSPRSKPHHVWQLSIRSDLTDAPGGKK